jgi:two-component SAPR family response regulator
MTEDAVRILILEDDVQLRSVLEKVLEAEGHLVTAASRGEQAIACAQDGAFDLVVADIRMEGMDGLQALEAIQQEQPEVRSLVITGYSTEADSIRAIRLGVNDYLTKPFRLDKFLDSINAIIAKRRLELERVGLQNCLRQNLLWFTKVVARLSDKGRQSDGLKRLSQRAQELCQALCLNEVTAERVQLASLLAALGGVSGLSEDEKRPELPASISRVLHYLDERWDGQGGPEGLSGEEIPLESRVVATLLAAYHGELSFAADDGRLDPKLVEALQRGASKPASHPSMEPAKRRGLLSLGWAMAAAGKKDEAAQAFLAVSQCRLACREKAEALLGLGRVAQERSYYEQAVSVAEQLGASSAGAVIFRAGLALSDDQTGRAWLKRSGSYFRQLGDSVGQAKVVLGLNSLGESVTENLLERAVSTLLRAENRPHLLDNANWLIPYTLAAEIGEPQRRLTHRLLRDAIGAVTKSLNEGLLSGPQRARLVQALHDSGCDYPETLQSALCEDGDPEVRALAQRTLQTRAPAFPTSFIKALCMGPFEIFIGGERVQESDWKTRKVKFLLAWLLAQAGQAVTEDRVLDEFWPEDFEKGRQSLYWTTSAARRVLRDGHDGPDPILRNLGTLAFNPEWPRWHDLEEIEKLHRRGKRDVAQKEALSANIYRPILELYRGPYLESCYMNWADGIRTRLHQETTSLLYVVASQAESDSNFEVALEFAEKLTEIEPCSEAGLLLVMRSLLELGRPEQIVSRFEAAERDFRIHLDAEPTIPMVELFYRAKLSL